MCQGVDILRQFFIRFQYGKIQFDTKSNLERKMLESAWLERGFREASIIFAIKLRG